MEHIDKIECGCELFRTGSDEISLRYCDTHTAAPDLLTALEQCQQLAIDRIKTADAAVKTDVYAADALMGIAKTARAAIEAAKGDA